MIKKGVILHLTISGGYLMINKLTRRAALGAVAAAGILGGVATTAHAADMTFTLATSGSETDMRSAPWRVFAQWWQNLQITNRYNGTMFAQGTELKPSVVET